MARIKRRDEIFARIALKISTLDQAQNNALLHKEIKTRKWL